MDILCDKRKSFFQIILWILLIDFSFACPNATDGVLILSNPVQFVDNQTFAACQKDVTTLQMSGLGIQTVASNSLEFFYQLKTIDLSFNDLSYIPPGLFDNKWDLETIRLNNNAITSLHNDTFQDTLSLKTLYMQFNNISFIGLNVFHKDLVHLETVNISYNKLTYFEPWPFIPEVPYNDDIDLDFDFRNNIISEFKNDMHWVYNLKPPYEQNIYLMNNQVRSAWDSVVQMYHPGFVGDELSEFLTYNFNVTENPFLCDCKAYPYVYTVHNSFLLYYRVERYRYRCAQPSHLAGIDLLHDLPLNSFVCNVTIDCPSGCFCQEQPHNSYLLVDCQHSNMTSLPEKLPVPQYGYISMHLGHNQIQILERRNYSSLLKSLNMSHNYLVHLDDEAISTMTQVDHLDLSNNYLQFVPKTLQSFTFDKVSLENNKFQCNCDMTWMTDWIKLTPNAADVSVTCDFESEQYQIYELTRDKIDCNVSIVIIVIVVVVSVLLAIIIGAGITAKRCPYETKVLLFRLFGMHPADKYRVDFEEARDHDVYISCFDDVQTRQWIKSKFLRKLEEGQNRKYKVFFPERDLIAGQDYFDNLVSEMKKSRRIVFLLTNDFFNCERNIFEADQAELEHLSSDNLHGRVIYIIWNETIRPKLEDDPWKSRVDGKRVLCPDDRFFWSKMRYELPLKPLP